MFKSISFKKYDSETSRYTFNLEDTEFGNIEVELGTSLAIQDEEWLTIISEYAKRNLNVGKNLAIHAIWRREKYNCSIQTYCKWQNLYLPKFHKNWKGLVKSRNSFLRKFLIIA